MIKAALSRGLLKVQLLFINDHLNHDIFIKIFITQAYKEVVTDSPRLADFAVGLVNLILHLPNGQVKVLVECFFEEINLIRRICENFFGLVKIASWLVHPGHSLPEFQAGKLLTIFLLYLNF